MKPILLAATLFAAPLANAQGLPDAQRTAILAGVAARENDQRATSQAIWHYAEVGYQETKSSALLQANLKKAGFTLRTGVAGMPTAFVASFRNGPGPVIAILAEYDALPGISQTTAAERQPLAPGGAGHACGHNLFGAASATAAMAVRDWMVANRVPGELRVYGTPAEEGGSGKVYMVRAGLFDDVSATLHWHPGSANVVSTGASRANISGKFRFAGLSAHAAASPERGRSALDGVEVMNMAVNLMREHVPSSVRIHYVITNGGQAPNVVPDAAEVYYYVRDTDAAIVRSVWDRVVKASEGAAMATGTRVSNEITGGVHAMLASRTLAAVMDRNLRAVGGVAYTPADTAWATKIQATLERQAPLASAATVLPVSDGGDGGGSTDVADVSLVTPTIGLSTATWVPGTPAHSWQAVAASGGAIGEAGAIVAAKAMALTAADLFRDPATLTAARAELVATRGEGFRYAAMLGDRPPALDYRRPVAAGSE